jgi:hypothetical protein
MESRKLSAFFPSIRINASLADAWAKMVDFRAWNPNYAHSEVTTLRGVAGEEGEVARTQIFDANGNLLADYFAETVRIVPQHHITWAVYPAEGDDYLNFADFEILERDGVVEFFIQY